MKKKAKKDDYSARSPKPLEGDTSFAWASRENEIDPRWFSGKPYKLPPDVQKIVDEIEEENARRKQR